MLEVHTEQLCLVKRGHLLRMPLISSVEPRPFTLSSFLDSYALTLSFRLLKVQCHNSLGLLREVFMINVSLDLMKTFLGFLGYIKTARVGTVCIQSYTFYVYIFHSVSYYLRLIR